MKYFFALSMLLFIFSGLYSQGLEGGIYSCGIDDSYDTWESQITGAKHHCFDVDEIQESCTNVWIRVNVHFFVNTDCSGSIYPLPNVPYDMELAYSRAEQLINDCNNQLANTTINQWAQIPMWGVNTAKPIQCCPIRYALSGVYIHCNTAAKNTSGSNPSWFRNNFGVNVDTEFNVFMVEWRPVGGSDSQGQADAIGGRAFTAETFSRSVFNHEMGHVLGLRHTFSQFEGLNDTPTIRYKIDYNCDGDVTDSWQSGKNENTIHTGVWCKPIDCSTAVEFAPLDYDGDGVINYQNPCNPQISELEVGASINGCLPQPACEDDYHSNNIMNYSSYVETYGVFTEDQITAMLDYLSSDVGCEFIETITDDICLPPMSNIHILPNESVDEDCVYCFQIGASMYDTYFKLDFYAPSGALQFTTDWRNGPAWQYCISRSVKYATQYRHGFVPGVQYTAVLTTENECGEEAEESITFILPQLPTNGCEITPPRGIEIKSLYPNPFIEVFNLEYKTERSGSLATWLIPSNNGSDILLGVEYVNGSGTYNKPYTTQNVPSGMYYLVLDLDGTVIGTTLLKI
jgi:hypothetical protein